MAKHIRALGLQPTSGSSSTVYLMHFMPQIHSRSELQENLTKTASQVGGQRCAAARTGPDAARDDKSKTSPINRQAD
jgi:hypothetical protein